MILHGFLVFLTCEQEKSSVLNYFLRMSTDQIVLKDSFRVSHQDRRQICFLIIKTNNNNDTKPNQTKTKLLKQSLAKLTISPLLRSKVSQGSGFLSCDADLLKHAQHLPLLLSTFFCGQPGLDFLEVFIPFFLGVFSVTSPSASNLSSHLYLERFIPYRLDPSLAVDCCPSYLLLETYQVSGLRYERGWIVLCCSHLPSQSGKVSLIICPTRIQGFCLPPVGQKCFVCLFVLPLSCKQEDLSTPSSPHSYPTSWSPPLPVPKATSFSALH